ncbi:putative adhesin [Ochrobactrum sp. GPK 3]|uniref:putative adhesin n=1 Tax=Brucella sp. 22210 TaxID=3453892 RepID=UPI0031385C1A
MLLKRSLGDQFYLFSNTETPAAGILLITAHGSFLSNGDGCLPLSISRTLVPIGTRLSFFSQHGYSTSGAIGLAQYCVIPPVETLVGGDDVINYRLHKYKDDDDAIIRYSMGYHQALNIDVMTIRNRWHRLGTSLADVFLVLRRYDLNYTEIRCAFCRSPALKFNHADAL